MTDKEKIRAEVYRRFVEAGIHEGVIAETREDELSSLLDFIDSLQEEPVSEDLEEAAISYAATGEFLDNGKEMIDFQKEMSFKAGAKWQKNYVWHDAKKEKPERMEPLLIDDGIQFVIGDKTCIEETDKWCYITNILPNKED